MTPVELKYSILKLAFTGRIVQQNEQEIIVDKKAFSVDEAPFDVPENWKWNYIGNICEMYTGDSIAENVKKAKYEGLQDGFDYIGTKDVSFNHKITYDNGVRIPFKNDFKRAYPDCILMCIEGGSAGRKIAILDREVCFGNKLCMFKATSAFNKYIYYYLQSSEFKSIFKDNLSGIIGGVSIKKIKNILIPIPPIEEQKRIVSKIEELLPLVDRYEEAWIKLEKLNKKIPTDLKQSIIENAIKGKIVEQNNKEKGSLFLEVLKKEKKHLLEIGEISRNKILPNYTEEEIPFDVPSSWAWCRLNDLTSIIGDGIHGTPQFDINGEYYFVNGNNLENGKIVFRSDTKKVSYKEYIAHKKSLGQTTILMSINGTIGNLAYYNDEKIILGKSACYINLLPSCCKEYIYIFLQSKYFIDYATNAATQTTIKNVSLEAMRNVLVPIPPLEEQKRIVAKLEELLPLCRKLIK